MINKRWEKGGNNEWKSDSYKSTVYEVKEKDSFDMDCLIFII